MGLTAKVFDDGLGHGLEGGPQGSEDPEDQRGQDADDDHGGVRLDRECLALVAHGEALPPEKRGGQPDAHHTTGEA